MIDILTGTAFDTPKRMHHYEDVLAAEFPSSVSSRARNLLALKAQNWRAGAPTGPTWEWRDGYTYTRTGALTESDTMSALITRIPVTVGHTLDLVWPSTPSSGCTIEFKADGSLNDYWTLSSYGKTGWPIRNAAVEVVFPVPTIYKDVAYLYDKTAGVYLFGHAPAT